MDRLQAYDATQITTRKQAEAILKIAHPNEMREGIEERAETAVKMKALFWSEKYRSVLPGRFPKQQILKHEDFVERLTNTINDQNNTSTDH